MTTTDTSDWLRTGRDPLPVRQRTAFSPNRAA